MVETKTKDNVFVQIPVAVQYETVEGREREAFYRLSDHEQQIIAYVQDNVRSSVANMNLDDSFSSKDTIAQNVGLSLRDRKSTRLNSVTWPSRMPSSACKQRRQ